jgi:hypothetical protein
MVLAIADLDFTGNISGELYSDCESPVECVPPILRQQISFLFTDSDADYERIFLHLLRYAQVDQAEKMATIIIPNQWKLHQQDSAWPCCYSTLNTFIRLLCALGILCKVPRRKNCAAMYHLPLVDYEVPHEAIAALDNLIDPEQTKNKRVRNLANHIKSRLNQLRVDQQESTMHCNQVDSDLTATLDTMQELIISLEGVNAEEKQGLLNELDRAKVQVQVLTGASSSKFYFPLQEDSTVNTSSQCRQKIEKGQPVDSGATTVDSLSSLEMKKVEFDALQEPLVDSGGIESNARLTQSVYRREYRTQNLPSHITNVAHAVDSDVRNLPPGDCCVDSSFVIDNDRDISSKRILQENQTIVTDETTPESTTGEPRVLYRPVDARSAQVLARFVEGNPGNFRSYITLTRKYHPQVIRAAIINMLAHTYFPDLDGDLPDGVDGELTGKVGRPRKPGAWVTTCCQAYAQYGIPPVMEVLLREYAGSYNEIRQCMESLARELSPKQFWMMWQESLLLHAEEPPVSQCPSLTEDSEIGDSIAVRDGISGAEVRALVDQINREGSTYGIAAHPCLQGGCWEVEIELSFQGCTTTHRFHNKRQWEHYLSAIQHLPQSM